METLQYIDHSLSMGQHITSKKHPQKPLENNPAALFFLLFFLASILPQRIFSQESAPIKIALLDTGICIEKIKNNNKILKIETQQDLTNSVSIECHNLKRSELQNNPRFHGHLVLEEFIKFIDKKIPLSIFPFIIFDKFGRQDMRYWENAVDWIRSNNPHFVLTAAGLITQDKYTKILPGIWFIPSGRNEKGIDSKTQLFPQNLSPQLNIFMIGDFFDGPHPIYDQNLKYQNQIDYYFPSGTGHFTGTSRAVAEALARAINIYQSKCKPQLTKFKSCLSRFEKNLTDPILKKKFKTY